MRALASAGKPGANQSLRNSGAFALKLAAQHPGDAESVIVTLLADSNRIALPLSPYGAGSRNSKTSPMSTPWRSNQPALTSSAYLAAA